VLLALACSMALLSAAPALDEQVFAERAKQLKVGSTLARVRDQLGTPHSERAEPKQLTYRNPPHRPDGPYQQYTFTFEKGKVTHIEVSGVGCVYRE
jgi:hypothetical protein